MASIINATTSNGLLISPDNSGQIQFQLNGVNVPSPSVAPAFSAYQNQTQSVSNATFTKIQFNVKNFDTNNNYDATTNYRFTPTVAGYYQFDYTFATNQSGGSLFAELRKNGSRVSIGTIAAFQGGIGATSSGSALIYCNGSTDYIEMYGFQNSGATVTVVTDAQIFGFLARTA